jgi:hypothetical protein
MSTIFTAPYLVPAAKPLVVWGQPGLSKAYPTLTEREFAETYYGVDYSGSMPDAFIDSMAHEVKTIMSRSIAHESVWRDLAERKARAYAKFTPKPYRLPSVKRLALLNSVAVTG